MPKNTGRRSRRTQGESRMFPETRESARLNGGWLEIDYPSQTRWWQFWRRDW